MRTLAEAVIRRGRIFHQEMNSPVYAALQGLATAVQVRYPSHQTPRDRITGDETDNAVGLRHAAL